MAVGARRSVDIAELAQPSLLRLSERSADTALLSVRSGVEALYLARSVGSHPLQPNYLQIGSRRPLGVGAGALALLAELGTRLGHGIASVCAVLDPRLVVIGGGVSRAGDLLVGPARAAFERHQPGRGHRPTPEVVLARLGNDAGMVGAADRAQVVLAERAAR